ncbi:MAG: translesion error-prone DNA polymerase V subunit UmuC [Candidatus Omnitrophica bacterium]|nr:translesion error-prone DNA polymerase V subunit UmuC [Candidatus Omnitrophota bacterium]
MIALVDCNNFYVSCERVFKPSLNGRAVVVLSNNDGCVISRSQESKDLGIKMGAPLFKCETFLREHGVKIFSSNYALYADMSKRVMETLSGFAPDIEVYSIDEAFLKLPDARGNLTGQGRKIRRTVLAWTGIPVSVGIAGTKVLAKIANELAKKDLRHDGVFDLSALPAKKAEQILGSFPVEGIWGVGTQYAKYLKRHRISTALDLKRVDPRWARAHMTVTGERLVRELNGTCCMDIESVSKNKKEITSSRSFGRKITDINQIKEAVSDYATRAAVKLRRQGSVCSGLFVFIMTSSYDRDRYYNGSYRSLATPTAGTSAIIRAAHGIIDRIYLEGKRYAKAGVILMDISGRRNLQLDLFEAGYYNSKSEALMHAVDKLNSRWGRGLLSYASNGIMKKWAMRRRILSPGYSTRWDEIPIVKA